MHQCKDERYALTMHVNLFVFEGCWVEYVHYATPGKAKYM
jgi:hypothetical protein